MELQQQAGLLLLLLFLPLILQDIFVVSPEPDLHVYTIDISKQRCLILGTDGAWNVLSPEQAVNSVRQVGDCRYLC